MFIGTTCPRELAIHRVRLAIVSEIALEYLWRNILHISIENIMIGHTQLIQLCLNKSLSFLLSSHMNNEYLYFCHNCNIVEFAI